MNIAMCACDNANPGYFQGRMSEVNICNAETIRLVYWCGLTHWIDIDLVLLLSLLLL